jgi:hypothetical protein
MQAPLVLVAAVTWCSTTMKVSRPDLPCFPSMESTRLRLRPGHRT